MCLLVCVCVRERERERKRELGRHCYLSRIPLYLILTRYRQIIISITQQKFQFCHLQKNVIYFFYWFVFEFFFFDRVLTRLNKTGVVSKDINRTQTMTPMCINKNTAMLSIFYFDGSSVIIITTI